MGLRKLKKKEKETINKTQQKIRKEYAPAMKKYNDAKKAGSLTDKDKKEYKEATDLYKDRSKAVRELKTSVDKLKENDDDFDMKNKRIEVAINALTKWADSDQDQSYRKDQRKEGVKGGPSAVPAEKPGENNDNAYKCNRFVADCIGEVFGFDVSEKRRSQATGKEGYPLQKDEHGNNWPAQANTLATNENLRSLIKPVNTGVDGKQPAVYKGKPFKTEAGDVVSFKGERIGHTGIAVGNGMIIDATGSSSTGVGFRPISEASQGRDTMVRRYIGGGK